MKVLSCPPFVVFFDTIAIFLFILILNQSTAPKIELPEGPIHGETLVFFDADGTMKRLDTGKTIDISRSDVYITEPCQNRKECINAAASNPNIEPRLLLPDSLTAEISKLTMLALRQKACATFTGIVSKSGTLDRQKTIERNPCLSTIQGIEIWAQSIN